MYYIGVDGGGTKTAAILFDTAAGDVRTLRLGSGNICLLGKTGCIEMLKELKNRLLSEISADQIAYSTFAFAGAGRPAERAMLESAVKEYGFKQFSVLTDAELLHYSFFENSPGILIASGTGSVCLLNSPDGSYHQIGGWGYVLGDQGSGFHIGKLAISHILATMDSGWEPTKLIESLLDFYKIRNPKDLISHVYAASSPQVFVASCAERVDELAGQGDCIALGIIDTAAEALVQLATKAMVYCKKNNIDTFNIALAGNVLKAGSRISLRFQEKMNSSAPNIEYCIPQFVPAAGAVMYSAVRDGYMFSEQEKQKLSKVEFPENKK